VPRWLTTRSQATTSRKQKLVEGTVTQWNYNNPHSWLMIEAPDANGEKKTWSFEGARSCTPRDQGVNGTTYKKGEKIRVVMHPMRDGRNAGALCFVMKEDGTFTRPNDGICDSEAVHTRWKQKGWLSEVCEEPERSPRERMIHAQRVRFADNRSARASPAPSLRHEARSTGRASQKRFA